MRDGLAGLRIDGREPVGMQSRRAIVDAFLRIECDENILVEVDRVGRRRADGRRA